jgi:3-deoxy-7-phosphoheptulonate synthase
VIIILRSDVSEDQLQHVLETVESLGFRTHLSRGTYRTIIGLIGDETKISPEPLKAIPGVADVVPVLPPYKLASREAHPQPSIVNVKGVQIGGGHLAMIAGPCSVEEPERMNTIAAAIKEAGANILRGGAYKPRTSPYAFQGHGRACLNYVFEIAGKCGIRVIAMEVTHEAQVEEIRDALRETGSPTGVMLQIGTRNTQNFELLKSVGRQRQFPVLIKRGFGITLDESLNAAEYLASEGNQRVIFGLRGMKTHLGDPHRNFVDFAHVPVVKRLTRMPVCIDPSHSVGARARGVDGILDLMHAAAQGVIAGANMILVDFHPDPARALVDGPQALLLTELPQFLEDIAIAREAYLKRAELANRKALETDAAFR